MTYGPGNPRYEAEIFGNGGTTDQAPQAEKPAGDGSNPVPTSTDGVPSTIAQATEATTPPTPENILDTQARIATLLGGPQSPIGSGVVTDESIFATDTGRAPVEDPAQGPESANS